MDDWPDLQSFKRSNQSFKIFDPNESFGSNAGSSQERELLDSIASGSFKSLEHLLDIVAVDPHRCRQPVTGATALHVAVRYGKVAAAHKLLEYDVDVCAIDELGATPLHYIANERDPKPELVKLLLTASADLFSVDRNGWTPLHWACMRGHTDVIPLLLDHQDGADSLLTKDKSGATPLHFAAIGGHVEVVAKIIEKSDAAVLPLVISSYDAQGRTAVDRAQGYRGSPGHDAVDRLLRGWKLTQDADWRRQNQANRRQAKARVAAWHRGRLQAKHEAKHSRAVVSGGLRGSGGGGSSGGGGGGGGGGGSPAAAVSGGNSLFAAFSKARASSAGLASGTKGTTTDGQEVEQLRSELGLGARRHGSGRIAGGRVGGAGGAAQGGLMGAIALAQKAKVQRDLAKEEAAKRAVGTGFTALQRKAARQVVSLDPESGTMVTHFATTAAGKI